MSHYICKTDKRAREKQTFNVKQLRYIASIAIGGICTCTARYVTQFPPIRKDDSRWSHDNITCYFDRDVNKAGSFKAKAKILNAKSLKAKARSLKAKTKAKARDQG